MKSKKLDKHIDFEKTGINPPDKNRLWDGIEPFLLTDNLYAEKNRESLLKGIEQLPVIYPSKNIWFKLSEDIEEGRKNRNRQLKIRWISGVAAALLILITMFPVYHTFKSNNNPPSANETVHCGENLMVNEFLTQLCLDYPNKCTNSDFLELKNEILTLQLEKEGLQKQVFYNTGDATIHDLCNRIDDQINFLKKQMQSYVSL